MAFKWGDIPEAKRDSMERGVIAIRKINERETFHRWMQIGQSLDDAQQAAMVLANTNRPKGRAYNDAYKMIGEEVPDLVNINKTTRSHAIWMSQHREAVEKWHAALPLNIQQECNHPSSVKRRYDKLVPTESGNKSGELTPSQKKDESIRELQEKLDTANRKLRQIEKGEDGPLMTRTATPEEMVRVLSEWIPQSKRHRVANLLMKSLQSTVKVE